MNQKRQSGVWCLVSGVESTEGSAGVDKEEYLKQKVKNKNEKGKTADSRMHGVMVTCWF
jgi:hypothetical protein